MLVENSWPTPVKNEAGPTEHATVQAEILIGTIDRLENDNQTLTNTVSDLRHLLKRVAVQQEREAQRRKAHSKALEAEVLRLKKALQTAETHSSHFTNIASLWQEFIE